MVCEWEWLFVVSDRHLEVSSQEETGTIKEGMEPVDEGLSMMGQTTCENPTGWRMHIPSSRWTDGVLPQQRTPTPVNNLNK